MKVVLTAEYFGSAVSFFVIMVYIFVKNLIDSHILTKNIRINLKIYHKYIDKSNDWNIMQNFQ